MPLASEVRRPAVLPPRGVDLNGLILYAPLWHPDAAVSPFKSKDGYQSTCTVTGATWGKNGRNFNGVGNQIDCGKPAQLNLPGLLSGVAWIYARTLGANSRGTMFGKQAPAAGIGYNFSLIGGNRVQLQIGYALTSLLRRADVGFLAFNTWQAWGVSWDGTNLAAGTHIYINGVETTYSNTVDGSGVRLDDSAQDLFLGSANAALSDYNFDGYIEEVALYNRVLAITDFKRHYLNTKWRHT